MVDDVDEGIYEELDELQMMNQQAAPVLRHVQGLNTSVQNVLVQQNGINSDLMQLVNRLQFSDKVKPFRVRQN